MFKEIREKFDSRMDANDVDIQRDEGQILSTCIPQLLIHNLLDTHSIKIGVLVKK